MADREFSKLCTSWTDKAWDELDWGRVKDMSVREVLEQRAQQVKIVESSACLQCPQFLKHVRPSPDA